MPFFSIIVPIYRVEKYLEQCIDSILSQSFSDFELILVDDGSPDTCSDICTRYECIDQRVKVIHKENGGLVSARKAGINRAVGEYVLNVDGDDYIELEFLYRLNQIIRKFSPDMVAFSYYEVNEEGMKIGKTSNTIKEGLYNREQIIKMTPRFIFDFESNHDNSGILLYNIWGKAVKKDILVPCQEKIPDSIHQGEDLAVVMTTLNDAVQSLYIWDSYEYNYRIRTTSMIHTFDKNTMNRYLILYDFLNNGIDIIPSKNIDAFMVWVLVFHIIDAARKLFSRKEFYEYCEIIMTRELLDCVNSYRHSKLILRRKIQFLLLKHHMWGLFWLFYHDLQRRLS